DQSRVYLRAPDLALHSVKATVLRVPPLLPLNGHANDAPAPFLAHFNLPDEMGKVELEWHDGRVELDRDHELATEVMCGHIAHALRRVAPGILLPLRGSP